MNKCNESLSCCVRIVNSALKQKENLHSSTGLQSVLRRLHGMIVDAFRMLLNPKT